MVGKHGGNRLSKTVIRGEQPRALRQPFCVLIQKTKKHAFVEDQLFINHRSRVMLNRRPDCEKTRQLDDEYQSDEQYDDAAFKMALWIEHGQE